MASVSNFLLLFVAAFSAHIFINSPISPQPLHFPPPSSHPKPHLYSSFQRVEKIGEGLLKDPEDVAVDESSGIIYTATRDGWIKRMHKNGSWEDWVRPTQDHTLLGITISLSGKLLVCDAVKGLLRVGDDGVDVLASHVHGSQISFADDVIEASDGSIYFSSASTKFGLHNWYLDILEAKPHGKLLKIDPSTKLTTVLLDNLSFANGVALSKDQDYLLVCESWKFRCLKYWLKGEKTGTREVFVENLPGSPDNINLAPDGGYWIALFQCSPENLQFVHNWRILKHLIATFPKLMNLVMGMNSKATVVKVGADGTMEKMYEDPTGKVMSFVTSAFEFEDHLYLGSLNSNFIGKLQI
uniref:Strictosidine synthase conserved region domain-containing protein n=1 Tax=Kalanchoe fedtschenkoi TaxID=63787 RepID=A0A7N0UY36_KALFE